MSVPVGRRSSAGPPDLHRLASYGRGTRERRRLPLLPVLMVLLVAAVGAGGFVLGRVTAPEPEVTVVPPAAEPVASAPVTTAPAVAITAAVIHEIKQGENLQQIADLYGVTQEQLIAFNEIRDPNKIFWGLRLRIPPKDWAPPSTTAAAAAAAPAPAAPASSSP